MALCWAVDIIGRRKRIRKRFLAVLQSVDRKLMAELIMHHSFLSAQQKETSAQKGRNIRDCHREHCNEICSKK